jgi:hypothetical protein
MRQGPLDDAPATRPEPTPPPFGAPVVVDRHEDTSTASENRQPGAACHREAVIPVDSLRGAHPLVFPGNGFLTRLQPSFQGLTHRWCCATNLEDGLWMSRHTTRLSACRRTRRLFIVPGEGPSGFNDVPVGLGPAADSLMTTRWLTPGLASELSMWPPTGPGSAPHGSPGSR